MAKRAGKRETWLLPFSTSLPASQNIPTERRLQISPQLLGSLGDFLMCRRRVDGHLHQIGLHGGEAGRYTCWSYSPCYFILPRASATSGSLSLCGIPSCHLSCLIIIRYFLKIFSPDFPVQTERSSLFSECRSFHKVPGLISASSLVSFGTFSSRGMSPLGHLSFSLSLLRFPHLN